MTYRQLLKQLQETVDNKLDDDVTVYVPSQDEYYPVQARLKENTEDNVLDDGHLFLTLSE